MRQYYFTFRSVTSAMQEQKRLEGAGVRATVVRTPSALRKQGCGYSLYVRQQAFAAAQAILSQGEKRYQKVYCRPDDEQWEEVAL